MNASTGAASPHPFSRPGRPLVWAHRGASRAAPENTLAAFRLAAKLGADGVELDAQRCATGEVVVLHDESLGRTTGYAALLAETPLSRLRTLDAGARFSDAFRGERVPLLRPGPGKRGSRRASRCGRLNRCRAVPPRCGSPGASLPPAIRCRNGSTRSAMFRAASSHV